MEKVKGAVVLPPDVKYIIDTLMEQGYEAYAVGGCVRDSVLHMEPKDWDITTSARPAQVKACFRRTIDTGIQHGTVTVMLGKVGYEVTTYRIDGEYEDGRHPKSVEFSMNLLEDLKRRDFTINAMAYNDVVGLVDEFDGIGDLDRGVIRCVRNPMERFTEDALRMMRAVRFCAQLGFVIEEKTYEAMKVLAPGIAQVSYERIQVELTKTLLSANPEFVELFSDSGILCHVLPQIDGILRSEDKKNVLDMLKLVEKKPAARYAALLFPAGGERAYEEMQRLRLDNRTMDSARKLIDCMKVELPLCEVSMRHFLCDYDVDFWEDFRCFMAGYYKAVGADEQLLQLETGDGLYRRIVERGDCVSLKNLAVNGRDLMENGVEKGCQVGIVLKRMLEAVLEDPERNTREWLLEHIKS